MNYQNCIDRRKSIRNYKDKGIPAAVLEEIRSFLPGCHRLSPEIEWEARFLGKEAAQALSGVAGYKGFMIAAPAYLLLLSEEKEHYIENAGYVGEDLVLKLTDLGLASCWITFGSEEAVKAALKIDSPLRAAGIIAFGYAAPIPENVRLDVKTLSDVEVRRESGYSAPKLLVEDMVHLGEWGRRPNQFELAADPLWPALYAASRAPSYFNRQPVQFIVDGGQVVLAVHHSEETACLDERLNAGIVMLHFAVMRMTRHSDFRWVLGEPGKRYKLPEGYRALAWCVV